MCRELGIPCVTGIGEETLEDLINQNELLEVNGNSGSVRVLTKNKKKSNIVFLKGGDER